MSTEPVPDGYTPASDAEAQQVEKDQSSYVARGGASSGAADTGPAPADEQPSEAHTTGTAGGNALSGVIADDLDDAVSVDTGPEHPGTRRSS